MLIWLKWFFFKRRFHGYCCMFYWKTMTWYSDSSKVLQKGQWKTHDCDDWWKRCLSWTALSVTGNHKSQRQTALIIGVSRRSIQRMLKHHLHAFKRMRTSAVNANARHSCKTRRLYQHFSVATVKKLIVTDEKDFTQLPEWPCLHKGQEIRHLSETLSPQKSVFWRSWWLVQVCRGIEKQKSFSSTRLKSTRRFTLTFWRRPCHQNATVFMQDSTPSHRTKATQNILWDNTTDFISSKEWTLHWPDVNRLVDYSVDLQNVIRNNWHDVDDQTVLFSTFSADQLTYTNCCNVLV